MPSVRTKNDKSAGGDGASGIVRESCHQLQMTTRYNTVSSSIDVPLHVQPERLRLPAIPTDDAEPFSTPESPPLYDVRDVQSPRYRSHVHHYKTRHTDLAARRLDLRVKSGFSQIRNDTKGGPDNGRLLINSGDPFFCNDASPEVRRTVGSIRELSQAVMSILACL